MKALRIALAVVGVAVLIAAAGVLVVRSDWFREQVRQRIIFEAGRATGGKLEIGAFRFDWSTLTVELDNLTLHGTEPPGEAPLIRVKHAIIGLRIISLMARSFSVARVELESPQGHLIVQADGTINLRPPGKPDIGKVVDLKIGRFTVRDGSLRLDVPGHPPRVFPWNAHGENLAALIGYDPRKAAYTGDFSVAPVHLDLPGIQPLDAAITAALNMERNRLTLPKAVVKTSDSQIELNGFTVEGFTAPVITAQYRGRIAMEEIDRVFQLVNFRHTGKVDVTGSARFASREDYSLSGKATGSGLGYGQIHDITASANFNADPDRVRVEAIRLNALGGTLQGSGEVRDFAKFSLTGQIEGFDTRALTDLAGVQPLPWNGRLAGPFHATGNLSERDYHSLLFDTQLTVAPADAGPALRGEIAAQLTPRSDNASMRVTLGQSWLELPASRADFSGVFGERLDVKVRSRDVNELRPAIRLPDALLAGAGSFDGSLTGSLGDPGITGHAALNNLVWDQEHIDSLEGNFTASDTGLVIDSTTVVWNGLRADMKGSVGLRDWKIEDASPIKADFDAENGNIPKLLALAGRADVPVTGTVGAKGQVEGTIGDPHVSADFTLASGQVEGEPFDSIAGQARYVSAGVYQLTAAARAGGKRLNANARLDHSRLTFGILSNEIPLNQIAVLKSRAPDIAQDIHGTARLNVNGALNFSTDGKQAALAEVGGEINVTGLALGTRNFGAARITGSTKNGVVSAQFTSNAAGASLRGDGTIGLTGDYPVDAKLSVTGLRIANVEALLNPDTAQTGDARVDGSVEGQATLTGSARTPDRLMATIELSRVELRPGSPQSGQSAVLSNLVYTNDGPIRMQLANSVIRVESARFRSQDTNVDVSGQIALNDAAPLDLRIRGTVGVAGVAQKLTSGLTATGEVVVNATLRGTYKVPDFAGRAELQNGDFRYEGFSNGLSNVKTVALFSGTRATIQSFTGDSGGGTVEAAGFASLASGLLSFRVEAKGHGVRVRYPEGISSVSDADLTLAGTEQRSELSGNVTIRRVSVNPRSDAASVLAQASGPIRTAAGGTGLAANMNLDIQVETAVDVVFETNVAQSIQADASLRLRGTLSSPALLGRINVTHGELVFFGNKYTINQGLLSFSDPARIAPVLNVDLETKARGVDVTLTVSGPISKLNVSYRSDPPLQFADIVALLATGRTPTAATLSTDTGQSRNFQQLEGSALLGQALANPAADRLQRFFGVSRVKIDPQLTGITGSPEARLTIEQEVTPELLFTYVSSVSSTSTQLIRVEWSFNRSWGAILTREENGYVGLDFAYKKRFK